VIVVDSALKDREASGNPLRVGMIETGFMGRGIALQIAQVTTGWCPYPARWFGRVHSHAS
jgi:predicted homoserine dehydrogenase-like protein